MGDTPGDNTNGPSDVLFNRVTLSTESTPLNFTEFELYDQAETNIALLGTASQTSTWGSANASTGINGGTDETVVSGYDYNFVATSGAGTWTLDLDRGYSLKELNRAVFHNRIGQSGEVNWFIGATINLHSVDDTVTEEIGVGTADLIQTFVITTLPPASIVESADSTTDTAVIVDNTRKFNQATITAAAGLSLNFAEFELYTVEGVNIAVLGTASNSRTDYGGEASRGNDGDTNPDWAGGSVVHTDAGGTWTLDFDQEYSQGVLDKVIFYNRLTSNERSIGALIRLHSSDGEDPLLVGTCTDEATQTFYIVETSDPSLLVLYRMNTSDLGYDSHVSGLHMTNTGVALVTDPERGPVASFNGSSTLVLSSGNVPGALLGSNPRTILFWIKHDGSNSTSGNQTMVYNGGAGYYERFLFLLAPNNVSRIDTAGQATDGTIQIEENVWAHMAITHEDGKIRLYVNGVESLLWNRVINTDSGEFSVGDNRENHSKPFSGLMSDLRFYDEALTAESIQAVYEGNDGLGDAPVTEVPEEEEEVTSVHWVQDSNSRYEVSSKEHLLQIMQNGSYLTNTGSTPANYRSVSFVQTADIDLESDITNIVPISTFTGTYDGQNFAISNWSCTPISGKGTAMFGYTNGATIQNVHLNGVWSTLNTNDGSLFAAHNTSSTFTNISTYFSSGTEITAVANSLGGLFSYTGNCTVQNITLGGTFDTFRGTAYTGGIVGYSSGSTYSHVRNIATFVTPLTGNQTGGIAGYYGGTSGYILNAMRGDIQGSNRTGGVYGSSSGGLNYVCNSMIGNISGTSAAGVVSSISNGGTCTHIINYMTGDVAHGLMGSASSTTLVNSIVAMTGATSSAAFGSGHGSSQVLLDESYGITYTSNAGTVSTMDTSAFEGSFDQPYWEFTNSPQWPFVFGNVGFNTSFDWILASETAVFTGVNDLGTLVVILPDPLVETQYFTATPGVLTVKLTIAPVSGATAYRLTSQETGSPTERVANNNFTDLNQTINNLSPGTEYTFRLYSTTGNNYDLVHESTGTTLENSSGSYDANDFLVTSGRFDLSSLDKTSVAFISDVMNEIFATGDSIDINVPGGRRGTKISKFVNLGANVTVSGSEALVVPFSKDAGSGQSVSLTLSDSSVVAVAYDEVSEAITVESTTYAAGESFILDGKKATVVQF